MPSLLFFFTKSLLPKAVLSTEAIKKNLLKPWYLIQHVNHSKDPLFLKECNYILSNKTWKGPTSFKMQCALPRQQGGIPSSRNMLTSLCGRSMGNRRGEESVETQKKRWNTPTGTKIKRIKNEFSGIILNLCSISLLFAIIVNKLLTQLSGLLSLKGSSRW